MTQRSGDDRERFGVELAREALTGYQAEHNELSATWRHIESKAQASLAIAGVFLAAGFAFVTDLTEGVSLCLRLLLAASIFVLVVSVILSLFVLFVRTCKDAPLGDELKIMIDDLAALEEPIGPGRMVNLIRDQTTLWADANKDVRRINTQKAWVVYLAQIGLVVAIVLIAVVTMVKTFT